MLPQGTDREPQPVTILSPESLSYIPPRLNDHSIQAVITTKIVSRITPTLTTNRIRVAAQSAYIAISARPTQTPVDGIR